MNDDVLAGLVVGLFVGGVLGAFGMALIATGSRQRLPPAIARDAERDDASGQGWAESSLRVDLLVDLGEVDSSGSPVAEAEDIDQEMQELMRRYGKPSGS
jgi:hypothetical protein